MKRALWPLLLVAAMLPFLLASTPDKVGPINSLGADVGPAGGSQADVNLAVLGTDLLAGTWWTPAPVWSGTKYYFDPNAVSSGTGTRKDPFRGLGWEIFDDSVIERRATLGGAVANAGAVVTTGDVCVLLPGNHGKIQFNTNYFTTFLGVVGLPGATAEYIKVHNGAGYYFENIDFSGKARQLWDAPGGMSAAGFDSMPNFAHATKDSATSAGAASRIVFKDLYVSCGSTGAAEGWADAYWDSTVVNGIFLRLADHVHIQDNRFSVANYGIKSIGTAPDSVTQNNILRNTGTHLAGDGIQLGYADSVDIRLNDFKDFFVVNDNHVDMIQAYGSGTDILVSRNRLTESTDASRYSTGFFTGIHFSTSNVWDEVTIVNNDVSVLGTYSGIAVNGGSNVTLAYNTVVGLEAESGPTPHVDIMQNGTSNIVANNISGYADPGFTGTTYDNNVDAIRDYSGLFQSYTSGNNPRTFNLQPDTTGALYDTGTATGAPATDFAGNTRPVGNARDIGAYEYTGEKAADLTAPAAPQNLAATTDALGTSVTLDWDDNSEIDLSHYKTYYSTTTGTGYVEANQVTASEDTIKSLTKNTTYYFVAIAFDGSGNYSADSNEDSELTVDTTPPAQLIWDVYAQGYTGGGDPYVALNWSTAPESDLAGYNIYRGLAVDNIVLHVEQGIQEYWQDNNVTADSTYWYQVTAYDDAPTPNESAKTDSLVFTIDSQAGLAFDEFSVAAFTPIDTVAGGINPDVTATLNNDGKVRKLARMNGTAFATADTNQPMTWLGPANTAWSETLGTLFDVPTAWEDSGSIFLDWDASTGDAIDGYLVEVLQEGDSLWQILAFVAYPDSDFTHAADDANVLPRRGWINYRVEGITISGTDTTTWGGAILDSLYWNQAVQVDVEYHARDTSTDLPISSGTVSRTYVSRYVAPPPDETPPDTTGIWNGTPFIAWGDTTNTNARITLAIDAAEVVKSWAQFKLNAGGTWTPSDSTGNWELATATAGAYLDTINTLQAIGDITVAAEDTLYVRARFRDMTSPPNRTAWHDSSASPSIRTVLARAVPPAGDSYFEITIPSDSIAGTANLDSFVINLTLDNFPSSVLDADGAEPAVTGGGGLRFLNAAGDTLPRHIVHFDTNNNPALADVEIKVLIPTVTYASDTVIRCFFGTGLSEPGVASNQGQYATWTGHYAVWLMDDLTDATGLGNTLTNNGADQVAGMNGGAYDFVEVTDQMTRASVPMEGDGLDLNYCTVWAKITSVGTSAGIMNYTSGAPVNDYRINTSGEPLLKYGATTWTGTGISDIRADGLYHQWAASGTRHQDPHAGLFVWDGYLRLDSETVAPNGTPNVTLGNYTTASAAWRIVGQIDEVRYGGQHRTAEWMAAEYSNRRYQAAFAVPGAVQ